MVFYHLGDDYIIFSEHIRFAPFFGVFVFRVSVPFLDSFEVAEIANQNSLAILGSKDLVADVTLQSFDDGHHPGVKVIKFSPKTGVDTVAENFDMQRHV
ncbi:MAG: hypothetical protein C0524_11460 [Rhodobacter sp.]|nr:hypothetical protein [Rhodobacter sp.]